MIEQLLRLQKIVNVNGFDRMRHRHDASGFLFVPYEYNSTLPSEVGERLVEWQVLRGQVTKPREAFVRIGEWPDVQYYVKLDCFEDHAEYLEQVLLADVDPVSQLEWADILRRVQAAY